MTPDSGDPIIPTDSVKDLGVYIDNEFTYSTHVSEVCKKVKKRIGWILRTFQCREVDFMKHVWKVYILPIIDYCSQLWAPRYGGLLVRLENLQKDFTARITYMGKYNYWERLEKLKMLSISRRLERYRIIYTRKILNGDSLNCGLVWRYTQDKGNIFKVNYSPNSAPVRVKTIRLNSYQVQGPELFNLLSKDISNSTVNADI